MFLASVFEEGANSNREVFKKERQKKFVLGSFFRTLSCDIFGALF